MALMTIKEYRETMFTWNSRPSTRTIKRWIEQGRITGRKIGGQYYVDPDTDVVLAVNHLVLRVLNRHGSKTA